MSLFKYPQDKKTDSLLKLEIRFFFPRIPKNDLLEVIEAARSSVLYRKAILTRGLKLVTAYIRHRKTSYDDILKVNRELARSVCQGKIRKIQDEWGFKKGRLMSWEHRRKFEKMIEL